MDLKLELANKLSAIMPKSEAMSEIDFVLKEHFGVDKTKLMINPELINNYKRELDEIIEERLRTRKPLQYIINKAVFGDNIYYVDKNVLIPRPETEILVQEVSKYLNSNSSILEIGTGSGCIAISLAQALRNDNIVSCDISQGALDVAKLNADKICPERKINFINSNLFENIDGKFDAIVSNPPYIDETLKVDMLPEVLNFEPHNALFAENEGMLIYEKIIEHAPRYLNNGGLIAFECGINQAQKIKELLENNAFLKVIIITDLSSIDRIVLAWYN